MEILSSDLVVGVDVDDTLVSWQPLDESEAELTYALHLAPHNECKIVHVQFNGKIRSYWSYPSNIESLKTHKHKGHKIIVWSGSGWEWAAAVVAALQLEKYVDLVTSKPKWLLDDMRPEEFMPRPYWGAGDPGKAKLK